ncbi:hypothetical protein PSACC_01140 [Paramicrosporidium saccamoebae]|uniref:Uncharacterized protein n=1 Tax=Paramicrosporidium saccamoebae TaxID=1246581 RepID=A0A2H9TMT8_9FUNG|nr:hypothetical protein PSACC_01140 [Paramicrosporidium saccamoebae]
MQPLYIIALTCLAQSFVWAAVKKHIKNNPAGALFTGVSGKEITQTAKVVKALAKGSDVVFVSSPKKVKDLDKLLTEQKYHLYTLHKVRVASKSVLTQEGGVLVYTHSNGRKILLDVGTKTETEMLKQAEWLRPQDPDYIMFRRKDFKNRFLHAVHMPAVLDDTKIGKGTVTLQLLEIAKMPAPEEKMQSGEMGVFKLILWICLAVAVPAIVVISAVLVLRSRAKRAGEAKL